MVIVAIAASLFLTLAVKPGRLVPTRGQSMAEMSYEFVANMIHSATGEDGLKFFPFVFTLFIFVLFSNFFGMMPGSFTVTSQIAVTFALACLVILTGDRGRLHEARHRLPETVRAARALVSADPADPDRGDLVPHPPDQPFRPSVRQHAGRPHHAGGVRRLRRRAGRGRRHLRRRSPSRPCC